MVSLAALSDFGAAENCVFSFEKDGPHLLQYASLVQARVRATSEPLSEPLAFVLGVYEWQSSPLVYVVDGEAIDVSRDKDVLDGLRRLLAMRGDASYMALLRPGSLDIYTLALDKMSASAARVGKELEAVEPALLLPTLANQRPRSRYGTTSWISSVILDLMAEAIEDLANHGLSHNDAISLVGRALFVRFLGDRDLLPLDELGVGDAATLFDSPEQIVSTCLWLDNTFNGDLLPISDPAQKNLSDRHSFVLGNIARRARGGQLHLGWDRQWADLNFAHIPVGVLSQAYEEHLRRYWKKRQVAEGGYYTPRPIAEMMVKGAIAGLDRNSNIERPLILDPASGAGVFLINMLICLVGRQWRNSDIRPDTAEIRRILFEQLRGFDINEAALRFSALGLYLISIELDPSPRPVHKLHFDTPLRGKVLFHVGDAEDETRAHQGSLGASVGPEHDGIYDVVIGNPPWSSGTKIPQWNEIEKRVAAIGTERAPSLPLPKLPNQVLDLPFVWRAMRWAKPGAQLAFALHGRLLFQSGEGMAETKATLFNSIDVTSVINGSEIRNTRVWPTIDTPFCILFANNRLPGPASGFRFITPRLEVGLNGAGIMRIDPASAHLIAPQDLIKNPYLLKILYRGSRADLEVFETILDGSVRSLSTYWQTRSTIPSPISLEAEQSAKHRSGNGVQLHRKSSRPRKIDGVYAKETGVDAAYLHGLPVLLSKGQQGAFIDATRLPVFDAPRLHDRRPRELFAGPLILVKKSPKAGSERIMFSICEEDLVFNETFYGYSASDMENAGEFVRYVVLVLGSKIAMWLALMLSGEFGVEREVIEKKIIDTIPFPPFESLTDEQRTRIPNLFEGLVKSRNEIWSEVDDWAAGLYGLQQSEVDTIEDTIRLAMPFSKSRKEAVAPTTLDTRKAFCDTLGEELSPLTARLGFEVAADPAVSSYIDGWQAVTVRNPALVQQIESIVPADAFTGLVDAVSASEVAFRSSGVLLLSRLDQNRFWSKTQARLCAQRILFRHLDALQGTKL